MTYREVEFGCGPDCSYCEPDAWLRLPWTTTAHRIVHGRPVCGQSLDTTQLVPQGGARRCRICRSVDGKQTTEVRRAPAGTYLGPDPLVALLGRYERGQL